MIFFLHSLLDFFGWHMPSLFFYTSFRMLMAAMTTLLLTIFLGPSFIRVLYQLKIGQKIRKEECPMLWKLHEKKENTPTMGGALILFAMLISLLFWMDPTNTFTLILFCTTIYLGIVGGIDDYLKIKRKISRGLRGRTKLFCQLCLGGLVALFLLWSPMQDTIHKGRWFKPPSAKESVEKKVVKLTSSEYNTRLYIPFFKKALSSPTFLWTMAISLFMIFVIVGSSNAVNLTDGLDGLASGCLIVLSISFAIVAFISSNFFIASYLNLLYIEGSAEIAVYMCALGGGALGFLWYNSSPAQIFMGDIGSLTLGGIIGVVSVLLRKEFLLAILGGIFVIEALSVILQVGYFKMTGGKRLFLCAPLHHHFEYKKMAETKVVVRFWIIALLFAFLGLLTLKIQ